MSGAIVVLALLSGCALGREFWRGTSTGSAGDCLSLTFEITIDRGRIEGWAMSDLPQGAVSWDVRGSLGEDNRVVLETVTQDPRVPQPHVSWNGIRGLTELTLTQTSPLGCQPSRTAVLRRP